MVDTTGRATAGTGADMDSPFSIMDMTTGEVSRPFQGRNTTGRKMPRSIREVDMTAGKVNSTGSNMSRAGRTVSQRTHRAPGP
jgi:hypothetical protein